MRVLEALLANIRRRDPSDKVVLVSSWTQINVFERLCERHTYSFLRLDGKTPVAKRQERVDAFNRPGSNTFIFLLSSKAGGVGLNLVGASKLILFDIDWNPSVCQQAMARVWRDGQKRPVSIFRLLTTGTIEERIYQRQITKLGLSGQLMDDVQSMNDFSVEELKNLFLLDDETACLTHDLLGCSCPCDGSAATPSISDDDDEVQEGAKGRGKRKTPTPSPDGGDLSELFKWSHVSFARQQTQEMAGKKRGSDTFDRELQVFSEWDLALQELLSLRGEDCEKEMSDACLEDAHGAEIGEFRGEGSEGGIISFVLSKKVG
ncbi:DNA repair and recombination protein rad54b [Quaeritorhiza haematococci]|nr:DNA repair and recombination protein rad54b [Quaeritorhiza haematococci]